MGRDQSYGPKGTESHSKQSSSKAKESRSRRSRSSPGDRGAKVKLMVKKRNLHFLSLVGDKDEEQEESYVRLSFCVPRADPQRPTCFAVRVWSAILRTAARADLTHRDPLEDESAAKPIACSALGAHHGAGLLESFKKRDFWRRTFSLLNLKSKFLILLVKIDYKEP
ncbi:hypothetical protein F2Q68_00026317 [Brassica cretica]|uniref:Uncharacterized protein n=1 Tax=Brassica cretica TaxID=69181 RepID=A0A8S9IE92_BRACR|nr:hypothetical protein F2Q68_00026317 [Brassica cretica]